MFVCVRLFPWLRLRANRGLLGKQSSQMAQTQETLRANSSQSNRGTVYATASEARHGKGAALAWNLSELASERDIDFRILPAARYSIS
jgi:hypothetical protein